MEKREKFIFLGSLSLISGYLKHAEASYFFKAFIIFNHLQFLFLPKVYVGLF